MISGIGVDIAEIDRIKRILNRYGDRFASRILSEREFDRFLQRGRSATYLASRFAAKEAVSKALGCGIADGITFHSIETINDDKGKPMIELNGEALKKSQSQGVSRCLVSLSDERHYAVAMVVLEKA